METGKTVSAMCMLIDNGLITFAWRPSHAIVTQYRGWARPLFSGLPMPIKIAALMDNTFQKIAWTLKK